MTYKEQSDEDSAGKNCRVRDFRDCNHCRESTIKASRQCYQDFWGHNFEKEWAENGPDYYSNVHGCLKETQLVLCYFKFLSGFFITLRENAHIDVRK